MYGCRLLNVNIDLDAEICIKKRRVRRKRKNIVFIWVSKGIIIYAYFPFLRIKPQKVWYYQCIKVYISFHPRRKICKRIFERILIKFYNSTSKWYIFKTNLLV